MKMPIHRAAGILLGGGVIAYPTEGVFGLGCLPDNLMAIARLLRLKNRDPGKGLILIAAKASQFDDWIGLSADAIPAADPHHPVTWIVPPGAKSSFAICGHHGNIAVRLTTNPVAYALCEAVDSPVVSTSANFSGRPAARTHHVLRRQFGALVDYIVPGECGPASGASEIRNLLSGEVLRKH